MCAYMTSRPRQPDLPPIGETLRERRVTVMNKSLRETAKRIGYHLLQLG